MTPAERRRYLELVTKHSVRLGALVGELFELAKLEADAVHRERFSLAKLVQDVVQKFELGVEQRGVALCAEVSVYPVVDADVGFLERVLENLLDNSRRHTLARGTVTLSLAAAPGSVTVAVTDTGSGMAPYELPHLLESYYRASRTGQAQERAAGAGLGLAISQRMLELHGSGLEIVSKVGIGTTVTFTLVSGRGLAPTVAKPKASEPT